MLNLPTSKFKLIFPKYIHEYISYLKAKKNPLYVQASKLPNYF